jgi:hypothetical protein
MDVSDHQLAWVILHAEPGRPRWHSQAACRGMGPRYFFPLSTEKGTASADRRLRSAA